MAYYVYKMIESKQISMGTLVILLITSIIVGILTTDSGEEK